MSNTRKNMTPEEIKRFIFAGNASITLSSTVMDYKIVYNISFPGNDKKAWFVYINTAELPETRWRHIGCISNGANITEFEVDRLKKSNIKYVSNQFDKEWSFFIWLLRVAHGIYDPLPMVKVTHNGFCGRCGRHLTDDKSVERGFGPICWKYVR